MSMRFIALGFLCAILPLTAGGILSIQQRDTYETGIFDESAAEIGAFDPETDRLFVVNGDSGAIDVFDISDPNVITLSFSIDVSPYGDKANSVAVKDGIVAAAVEADTGTDPGQAVFFDADGSFLGAAPVGALPDMIAFTPDGTKVLTANEGEPNDDYTVDPEGSISIVDISGGVVGIGAGNVTTAGFTAFNGATLDPSIRIYGPGATVAQDLEPEYIAVTPDSMTAFATCQENNALAVIDIASATVTALAYAVRGLALALEPYMPATAARILAMMNLKDQTWAQADRFDDLGGHRIGEPEILYRRLDPKQAEQFRKRFSGDRPELSKFAVTVGRVTAVERHPNSDRLYALKVDLGEAEARTIVAGLTEHYAAEELENRQVLVLANLKPAEIRGVMSQGMALTAEKRKGMELLDGAPFQVGQVIDGAKADAASIAIEQFKSAPFAVDGGRVLFDGEPLTIGGQTVQTHQIQHGKVR